MNSEPPSASGARPDPDLRSRIRGCLLGGAVGDALGAAVEFERLDEIRARYGPAGIQDPDEAYGRVGAITDDTQMTLFTAERLIRAVARQENRGICNPLMVVDRAYARWLSTQGVEPPPKRQLLEPGGWLLGVPELHERRGPGNTCLAGLSSPVPGSRDRPLNDSKGCGGIMRVAPVGLISREAFAFGCDSAALTHGHPSGYLSAGFFALLIHGLLAGEDLLEAIWHCLVRVRAEPDAAEVVEAVEAAVAAAREGEPSPEKVERLGGGWTGEEALGIALYCALSHSEDFAAAVRLAVNHSGDSDSTGAITGNLMGTLLGEAAIPAQWLETLELRDVISTVADDLIRAREGEVSAERYPPW